MLVQLGFADIFNIEVRAGLAVGLLDLPGSALLLGDLGHERQKRSVTFVLHAVGRNKTQRG